MMAHEWIRVPAQSWQDRHECVNCGEIRSYISSLQRNVVYYSPDSESGSRYVRMKSVEPDCDLLMIERILGQ